MADEAQRAGTRTSNLQSTIAKINNAKKQQAASSSAAAKSGSTTTSTVTSTPKVTNTAKAMPSLTRVDISKYATPSVATTPKTTPTSSLKDQAMNLLGSKTRVEPLRVADKGNLLDTTTEKKDIQSTTLPLTMVKAALNIGGDVAKTVTNNLYEQGLDWVNNKFKKIETIGKTIREGDKDLFNYMKEDIVSDYQQGKSIGNTILNTVQGLPRGIARAEYGLAELLDWAVDSKYGIDMRLDANRSDDLKESIKKDLDYWENTRTYKKVKETKSFSDFLENPLMYAGGTLTEMLPMFINAWVAVPTTFAQIYGETYQDYSQDKSLKEAGLNDNQVRLMSLGVAGVNTIIELGSDLVQGLMPWIKTIAKATEKEVRKSLTKPITKVLSRFAKGGLSEGFEEVFQNEIQDQVAGFSGSDRELPTRVDRLTTFGISTIIGWILQGGNVVVNVKQNKEIETAFNEWSEAVDKIAPGVSRDDKVTLFSSIVAAEVEDANMSEDRVANYEAQTTELYNRIDELEQRAKETKDPEEIYQIDRQIEDANQKIKNIDEIINKGNKVVEEVNRQLQELSQKRMEEQQEEETQAALEGLYNEINGRMGGEENLSEQTMNLVSEEKGKQIKLPDTPEGYKSFAEALRQPNNTILDNMSVDELNKTFKALKKFSQDNPFVWMAAKEDILFVGKKIAETIAKKNEENTKKTSEGQDKVTKKITFKNAQDYVDQMLEVDERLKGKKLTKKEREELGSKYMSNFIRNNFEGDFSRHLPGLKGVNLKHVEGQLTDEKLQEISEMLALVSATFGVDFNKVIEDKKFSMNISDGIFGFLYNPGTLGIMVPKYSRERIKEFFKRTGTKGNIYDLGAEIATAGVVVTLGQGKDRAGSIMSHELWHFIDFALSTEEGLPIVLKKKGSRNVIDYTSIIEGDYSWKTFKKGDAKKGTKDYNYYNDWSEILARYAEQYFAYKNAPKVFNELAGDEQLKINRPKSYYNWYWSEEEFLKLLPKFESFIKNRLGAKLLDEENQFYYDIVSKINQGVYDYKNMEYGAEKMNQTELQLKLLQMETNYAWILRAVEGMKGDLKEEMEAYVQLSNLQSNYEMAKATGEKYLEILNISQKLHNLIDTMTTTALPPVKTPDNPNPTPPQNPKIIRLGLPYYGGSNTENGIDKMSKGENPDEDFEKADIEEKNRMKLKNRGKSIKTFRDELKEAWFDLVTPAITRIMNRSPRIAGRLITMETNTAINTYRYKQKAKGFVESLGKLKGKDALEVKRALLDYGALASQQTEDTINDYKQQEVIKLRNVLLKHGFKEQDINDMFYVLNDIGRQYKESGLDITLTDMYFPRVVKDYEGLIDYMNRVSGYNIKVDKKTLISKIKKIESDQTKTDKEKEMEIRYAVFNEFHYVGTQSNNAKERKLGVLSEWGPGIYAYYENPIEALSKYIETMVTATQRQLFLGGMREDAGITEGGIINQNTAESVSTILGKLVEEGMISNEDADIIQKSMLAVLNKKPSPKSVTKLKDLTYMTTITNFLSAINQLDDLGMAIIKDKKGLIHVVKAIFGKAGIKYDELGLEDSYEMFREKMGITNWLFKKSFFNAFDRLGKVSFINAAWDSMIHQYSNEKTREFLHTRLVSMYGEESAKRMEEKIKNKDYKGKDGQMDIEILRDLLYQLGSTQPIFTSAMPITYLNHPWSRLCYALSSFTLTRINFLIQGTKNMNNRYGYKTAGAWLMGVSVYLAFFGAVIGDVGDWLKGKKDETALWKFMNEGIEEGLKEVFKEGKSSWLKIWDLSEYDLKTWEKEGTWRFITAKIQPFVFDLGADLKEAIVEHNKDEITDLAKYVPIFGKLVYYWCWDDMDDSGLLDLGGDLDLDLDLGGDLDLDLDGELLDL